MAPALTLRQLEIFLAVAAQGHVTRAAGELHLTQSAASMAIGQLERLLDMPLFERSGRRLLLTERGHLLAAEARGILGRVAALPGVLGGRGEALRGELRIAASQTVGRHLLAPGLAGFGRLHPRAQVQCHVTNTAAALERLLAHAADVAYVEGEVQSPALAAVAWRRDRLEIVIASAATALRAGRLGAKRLPGMPWIMREPGSGTRQVFDRAVRDAGLAPLAAAQTLNDTEAIRQAVLAGAGVACLPRLAVAADLGAGTLRILRAPFLTLDRQLWRVRRRDGGPRSPVLAAFEAFLDATPAADGS